MGAVKRKPKSIDKEPLREKGKTLYPKERQQRQARAKKIYHVIAGSEIFKKAQRIGIYSPLEWEVDITVLWQHSPQRCAFPLVVKNEIQFYLIHTLEELQIGYAKILEPPVNPSQRIRDWEPSDLILIPGRFFDLFGTRVGSGKGFYDRFLAKLPSQVQKWGICWQEQLTKERIAKGPKDVSMDAICTENGFFKC